MPKKAPEDRKNAQTTNYASDAPDSSLSDVFKNGRVPTTAEMDAYYRSLNRRNAAGEIVKIQGAVMNYGTIFKNAVDAEAWRILLSKGV